MNIAVLLSGGVDSSVVVHLLCEQGYRPSLFYIKIGRDDADYMDCSAEEDMEMASAIARRYGLSLEVVDLHREYWDQVAAYAIDKIRRGLTPNPDVMCNKLIKFGCFEQRVGKDFDITATGHYGSAIGNGAKDTKVTIQGHTTIQTASDDSNSVIGSSRGNVEVNIKDNVSIDTATRAGTSDIAGGCDIGGGNLPGREVVVNIDGGNTEKLRSVRTVQY